MPNLSVTRLRSKGLVGVLDRQDLLFTRPEVEQLFKDMLGQGVTSEMITSLYERTHGWATGLQLIVQAFEQRSEMAPRDPGGDQARRSGGPGDEGVMLEILKQSEEEIFDYFAEEVLDYESPETQELLMRLSLFKHIDPATAGCVLPPEEGYQLLSSLQRRNLFISHVEGGGVDEYSFHPMFRRFLRRRLKARLGESGMRALYRENGDKLMRMGKWQKAGLQYAEANDTEAMAKIMVEHGRELIDAGLFEIVKRGYEAVSASGSRLHPEIVRLRAHIARTEGDPDLAERLFLKAVDDSRAVGDARCEASSSHGLAAALLQRGEHARAYALAREALPKVPPEDLVLQAQYEQVLGNCRFLLGVSRGEFDDALESWRRGVDLARRGGNERLARIIAHNIGVPYAFAGDFARAREWFAQLVEGDAARVPVPQQALAYCNLSRADMLTGDFEACERHLDKAMEICRLLNLTSERAETNEMMGNLFRARGQFSSAREHYARAEDLYRDARMQLESRELPEEQLKLLMAEGSFSKALDAAGKLLEIRAGIGHGVPLARARLLLAQARIESREGDPRELLSEALAQFTACRSNVLIAQARMLLARAEHGAGNIDQAIGHLAEAVRIARSFNYSYWIKTEAERSPALFALAVARQVEPEYLKGLGLDSGWAGEGAEAGRRAAVAGRAETRPTPRSEPKAEREIDLTINLLGAVQVFRERDHRLSPDAWTLSRALRILCFIASRHNHRATKDAIIETFWPDTPLEDIDKNFWPTVSHIRRALNSSQEVKKNFIRYRESAYYLNPEFNYLLDTEEFERLVAEARAARRQGDAERFTASAHRASEIYRGDFLEEFYDNWAEEPRAYYRNIYFALLKELADHYHRAERFEQSISYCRMILKRDPYREDVHRQLMDAHARTGNRAALKEQYEDLRTLLMDELGVDPLPETTATYKRLVSGS
jgi:ATP/maltotriose-dependent transcriptional regulator MalT/DNA-binding SARP family transcriptional activator